MDNSVKEELRSQLVQAYTDVAITKEQEEVTIQLSNGAEFLVAAMPEKTEEISQLYNRSDLSKSLITNTACVLAHGTQTSNPNTSKIAESIAEVIENLDQNKASLIMGNLELQLNNSRPVSSTLVLPVKEGNINCSPVAA